MHSQSGAFEGDKHYYYTQGISDVARPMWLFVNNSGLSCRLMRVNEFAD